MRKMAVTFRTYWSAVHGNALWDLTKWAVILAVGLISAAVDAIVASVSALPFELKWRATGQLRRVVAYEDKSTRIESNMWVAGGKRDYSEVLSSSS